MLQADLAIPGEFGLAPGPAYGIVRIAQDGGLGGGIRGATLQIVPVDLVAAVHLLHDAFIGDQLRAVNVKIESIVDRRRHQHFRAGRGKGAECRHDAGMHTRGDAQILGRDHVDAIALMIPVDDALHERMVAAAAQEQVDVQQFVTPIVMADALLQRFGHHRHAFEIHVGDAHPGYDLACGYMLVADRSVPFHAIGADPIIGRVEIIFAVCRRSRRRATGRQRGGQGSQRQHAAAKSGIPQECPAITSQFLFQSSVPSPFARQQNSLCH